MRRCPSRILLKVSGEAFKSDDGALSPEAFARMAGKIAPLPLETAIVVGGGNILRGAQAPWIDRVEADTVGMLATVINAMVLRTALEATGRNTIVQSAVQVEGLSPISIRDATAALARGDVVIFAGGTGSPFVSTDTAAAIRAVAIHADLLAKASNVSGVYDSDPATNANAQRIADLTYADFLANRYGVMDQVSVEICREHNLPIEVFAWDRPGVLDNLAQGTRVGTRISG